MKHYGHKHETGALSMDYYAYQSNLRDWNSEFKVILSMAVLLICIIASKPWVSVGIILSTGFVTVVLGGLALGRYLRLMTIPIVFILLGTIAIGVEFSFSPGGDYNLNLHWFYLYITNESITKMLFLIMKVFGAIGAMYMMALSTPSSELFLVLRKAHVPKLIIELMNMIYRYIFILLDVHRKMKTSAESRLGFCDFRTSCYSFGCIGRNLLLQSLKKANIYYDAMESRCYDGQLLFLEEEKGVTAKQIIGGIVYVAVLISIWIITR